MRTTLVMLALVLGFSGATRAGEDPKERFFEARKVLLRGEPATAAELFRTLAREAPESEFADDCLYWMGRCWLRVDDREPDAVVALLRIFREHPESPWQDDAARELARTGDRSIVPELRARLEGKGKKAEMAARSLAEFGEEAGLEWLEKHLGEESKAAKAESDPQEEGAATRTREDEVAELRREVARLRKELDEAIALLDRLVREKEAGADGAGEDGR